MTRRATTTTSPHGRIALALGGLAWFSGMLWFGSDPSMLIGYLWVAWILLALFYHGDIRALWIGFSMPWIVMLTSAAFDISEYSRPIATQTIGTIGCLIFILALIIPHRTRQRLIAVRQSLRGNRVWLLHAVLLIFLLANVAYSGYIPAYRLNEGAASGYLDFGIPSFNGLFNAYANALAITDFFLWCTRRKKIYIVFYVLVLAVFALLVSRQNIVSVAVESFIIHSLVVKKPTWLALLIVAAAFLTLFGLIGDLRVGDASIAYMARISDEFSWLPSSAVWVYAYSYFNLLNVDNVITSAARAAFDLSSLASLLPSVLRPVASAALYGELEVPAFAVGSFIRPIYSDVGLVGLFLLFILFSIWGRSLLRRLVRQASYKTVCAYSVMYFCFAFSFFENFWFYLPVVSQLAFIPLLSKFLFAESTVGTPSQTRPAPDMRVSFRSRGADLPGET